jgi:hypothetical protein
VTLIPDVTRSAKILAGGLGLDSSRETFDTAKKAATKGLGVQSRRRVGSPWCCASASMSRSLDTRLGIFRRARRLKFSKMILSRLSE